MVARRCAECGFIAVRDRTTDELAEVQARLRGKWELPTLPNSNFKRYEDFPICLQNKASLRIDAQSYRPEDVLALIHQERQCDAFTPWQPGCTPKEHAEMQRFEQMQELAEERKKADEDRAEVRRIEDQRRQDARDDVQKTREDTRDSAQRTFQAEQSKFARQTAFIVAGFGAFIAIVVATASGYMTYMTSTKPPPPAPAVNIQLPPNPTPQATTGPIPKNP